MLVCFGMSEILYFFTNPEYHFTKLSSRLGFELTQYGFSNAFSSESIRKESPKEVHSTVKALCEDLLVKLDRYK